MAYKRMRKRGHWANYMLRIKASKWHTNKAPSPVQPPEQDPLTEPPGQPEAGNTCMAGTMPRTAAVRAC